LRRDAGKIGCADELYDNLAGHKLTIAIGRMRLWLSTAGKEAADQQQKRN
jgi:hypothetical protein